MQFLFKFPVSFAVDTQNKVRFTSKDTLTVTNFDLSSSSHLAKIPLAECVCKFACQLCL